MAKTKTKPTKAKFKIGDKVTFQIGAQTHTAAVIEDRGNLGVGGRRVYRLEEKDDGSGAARSFEMPESDLTRKPKRHRQLKRKDQPITLMVKREAEDGLGAYDGFVVGLKAGPRFYTWCEEVAEKFFRAIKAWSRAKKATSTQAVAIKVPIKAGRKFLLENLPDAAARAEYLVEDPRIRLDFGERAINVESIDTMLPISDAFIALADAAFNGNTQAGRLLFEAVVAQARAYEDEAKAERRKRRAERTAKKVS